MNTASHSSPVFLNENGVVITRTHLSAGGQTFELAKIAFVSVLKASINPMDYLDGQRPALSLLVTPAAGTEPVTVFETKDAAFMQRVMQAMDLAAAANSAARRRP